MDLRYPRQEHGFGLVKEHGNLDWRKPNLPKMPFAKETPAQRIKRLQKELEDELLKNLILNEMVDRFDGEYNAGLRKKVFAQTVKKLRMQGKVSLSRSCRLFGISWQAFYQRKMRKVFRTTEFAPVNNMVQEICRQMPRVGTRKLYYLLKPDLRQQQIKLGRDGLFDLLRVTTSRIFTDKALKKIRRLPIQDIGAGNIPT